MRKLLIVSVAGFAVTLAVLGLALTGDDDAARSSGRVGGVAASTQTRIAALQRAVDRNPEDVQARVLLASALLGSVREGGDPGAYNRADEALEEALEQDPSNAAAYTERAILRLGRHDFRGGLIDGRRARELAPGLVRPLGVLVDAYVELGRYQEAERTLQKMVDLKPNLDSYARVSYFRELRGDLDGASVALALAASAGGEGPENVAFVQSLLGNIELAQGRSPQALRAFRSALVKVPKYAPAEAGLARVDIAAGRLEGAITRLRAVVEDQPKQEYVVLLGETQMAEGRIDEGRRTLAKVRVERKLLQAAGENTDTEAALFEADHGDRRLAVRLGRAAWASAPSVRSADALGWALTRAGQARQGARYAQNALRLGSREASFLFHAGMNAKALGSRSEAQRLLRAALDANPGFSPLHARAARDALDQL